MSDTPRVDAAEIRHGKEGYSYLTVSVEFARQLERELCRLTADNERLKAALPYDWDQLEACRGSLREHMAEIKRLTADNKRLREALLRIKETKVFVGAIAQAMMDEALQEVPR
jgi:hypothetical protein